MIDENLKLVYRYMFTKEKQYLIALLINRDGMTFANDHFSGTLRQECIDLILDTPFLKGHFEQQEDFVKKYINPSPKPKGCFRRV